MKLSESATCYNYLNGNFLSISKLLHKGLAIQLHVKAQTPAQLEQLNNGSHFFHQLQHVIQVRDTIFCNKC